MSRRWNHRDEPVSISLEVLVVPGLFLDLRAKVRWVEALNEEGVTLGLLSAPALRHDYNAFTIWMKVPRMCVVHLVIGETVDLACVFYTAEDAGNRLWLEEEGDANDNSIRTGQVQVPHEVETQAPQFNIRRSARQQGLSPEGNTWSLHKTRMKGMITCYDRTGRVCICHWWCVSEYRNMLSG